MATLFGLPQRQFISHVAAVPGRWSTGIYLATALRRFLAASSIGRALARCDWNRDGRTDFVATHLDQPAALLENRAPSNLWLQLELIGLTSERGAVGASIDVHTD